MNAHRISSSRIPEFDVPGRRALQRRFSGRRPINFSYERRRMQAKKFFHTRQCCHESVGKLRKRSRADDH